MNSTAIRNSLLATSAAFFIVGAAAQQEVTSARVDPVRQESAGEMLDDAVTTTKVKTAFFQDATVSALRINVTSNKGIIQLSGFANSHQEMARAEAITRGVAGVRDVRNDIVLK